jgi:hypothetical protein
LAKNIAFMKKIFSISFFITLSASCFSQEKQISWFGEIHAGWQATLNEYPYTAQIKSGYENKPFDSSLHYAAFFKNQIPVQAVVGLNNGKGLQYQFSATYFAMKMALSNPPDISGNENYLFATSHILGLRGHILLDYSSLFKESKKSRLHLLSGISAGVVIPLDARLDEVTANHFGIQSFKRNIVWNLGLDFMLNIDLSKHFYITNHLNAVIPIAGNIGEIKMQSNSSYAAVNVLKITSLTISTGIGFRLY